MSKAIVQVRTTHNAIAAIAKRLPEDAAALQNKYTRLLESTAKQYILEHAYRTGALYNSVEARFSDAWHAEVVATAHHAVWVHFGTSRMRARPFFIFAIEQLRGPYLVEFRALAEKAARAVI